MSCDHSPHPPPPSLPSIEGPGLLTNKSMASRRWKVGGRSLSSLCTAKDLAKLSRPDLVLVTTVILLL
ncbi:unnamed protein product [Boreogadus saida]